MYNMANNKVDYLLMPLGFSFLNLDSLINGVALAMQFEFGKILYEKMCSKCDKKTRKCCDSPQLQMFNATIQADQQNEKV